MYQLTNTSHFTRSDKIFIMLSFVDYVKPICLPYDPLMIEEAEDNELWVAGWGATDAKGIFFTLHLNIVIIQLYHWYSYNPNSLY